MAGYKWAVGDEAGFTARTSMASNVVIENIWIKLFSSFYT